MTSMNKKIELTQAEREAFERQYKLGVLYQLHKEKLLTYEQLEQVSKVLEKQNKN